MPWVRMLPESEQKKFTTQLAETASRASSLGDYEMLDVLLTHWADTALIHANPALRARLLAEPDTDALVPRP